MVIRFGHHGNHLERHFWSYKCYELYWVISVQWNGTQLVSLSIQKAKHVILGNSRCSQNEYKLSIGHKYGDHYDCKRILTFDFEHTVCQRSIRNPQ